MKSFIGSSSFISLSVYIPNSDIIVSIRLEIAVSMQVCKKAGLCILKCMFKPIYPRTTYLKSPAQKWWQNDPLWFCNYGSPDKPQEQGDYFHCVLPPFLWWYDAVWWQFEMDIENIRCLICGRRYQKHRVYKVPGIICWANYILGKRLYCMFSGNL